MEEIIKVDDVVVVHLIPTQILIPSPNGNVLNGCRPAFASAENRVGSNFMGLGKSFGSREKAKVGIMTAVSFGRIDPLGNL